MASLEEVFSMARSGPSYIHDEVQFLIDKDLRTVAIPPKGVVIGVTGDKNVNRVNFQMPTVYNGFDLSLFQIRIDYVNALGETGIYSVMDTTVEEDTLYFTWLVDELPCRYVGEVTFAVRMIQADASGKILHAFHTTTNTAKVLEGLIVTDPITPQQATDLLEQMKHEALKYMNDYIDDILGSVDYVSEIGVAEDLKICNYTVKEGAMNFSNYSINDSVSNYGRLEYLLQGERYLLISGYAYSLEYGLWAFLDDNGLIVSKEESHPTGTQINGEYVKVPPNAFRVVVNIWNDPTKAANIDKPYSILSYAETLRKSIETIPSDNVVCSLEELEGTTIYGKSYKYTGTLTEGSIYQYRTVPVNGGETVRISGYHYHDQWPLCVILDANGKILYRATFGNTGHKASMTIKLPGNARTVIVNGSSYIKGQAEVYSPAEVKAYTNSVHLSDLYQDLKKSRYLMVGDSYLQGYSHDGNNSGWGEYMAEYLGLSESDYVICANGGASFASNTSNNTFEALIPSTYPTDYFTDVIVCGGYNDNSHTEAQILSGIKSFVTAIRTIYPHAKIHVGCIAYNKAGNGTGAEPKWATIQNAIKHKVLPAYQKCVADHVSYLTNVEYLLDEDGLTPSDGYHPSEAGNRAIAMGVANAVLTGAAPMKRADQYTPGGEYYTKAQIDEFLAAIYEELGTKPVPAYDEPETNLVFQTT